MKFCTEVEGPKSKKVFVRGQNSMTHSSILPQFFTPVIYFQWEGTAVTRPVDRLWRLGAQTASLGSGYRHNIANVVTPNFAPKRQKWGSMHFQWEYAWRRTRSWPRNLLSSISQQAYEIHGRFILTPNRKANIASPMVTWPATSRDPKRSRSWPQYL